MTADVSSTMRPGEHCEKTCPFVANLPQDLRQENIMARGVALSGRKFPGSSETFCEACVDESKVQEDVEKRVAAILPKRK